MSPARDVSSTPRLCDFCAAPRLAVWRYPRLSFMACEACHLLIEAGNRTGLAERTYATAPVPPDLKAAPGSREALMTGAQPDAGATGGEMAAPGPIRLSNGQLVGQLGSNGGVQAPMASW